MAESSGSALVESTGEDEVCLSSSNESVFKEASKCFQAKYIMQESLTKLKINRDDAGNPCALIFPTTRKWCYIGHVLDDGKQEHAGNNPYISVTSSGARFKCHDEEHKSADVGKIAFSDLPQSLQDLYNQKVFGDRVAQEIIVQAQDECRKSIQDNYPDETEIEPMQKLEGIVIKAHKQRCNKCNSTVEFSHMVDGWCWRCINVACGKQFPDQRVQINALVASERRRSKEEKHKLLIQQNPSATGVIYILDMGIIDGVHYLKIGATDDVGKRFHGLRSALEVSPNRCFFLDMIASPNNWAVEKAFHSHHDTKEHRVTLTVKGHNQTEIYKTSKKFDAVFAGNLLRSLSKDALANEEAKRIHEKEMLKMNKEIITLSIEQGKGRQEALEKLITAGLTGTDLKETLAILYPPVLLEARAQQSECMDGADKNAEINSSGCPIVGRFIEQCMEKCDDSFVSWNDVLKAYTSWPQRKRTLSKELKEQFTKNGCKYQHTSTPTIKDFLDSRDGSYGDKSRSPSRKLRNPSSAFERL